jgi:hypothetical protein
MKRLLNEISGIAESTIPYTKAVFNKVQKEMHYFFDNVFDEDYLESVEAFRKEGYLPSADHVKNLKLSYRYLAPYITDEDFEDFPVVQINTDLTFRYVTVSSPSGNNFSVEGGAWPTFVSRLGKDSIFGYRVKPELFPVSKKRAQSVDRAVVASIDFDIVIYGDFDPSEDLSLLEREIYSVIFHEMMHVYEQYKNKSLDIRTMKLGSSKPKSKAETSKAHLGSTKMVGVPREIQDAVRSLLQLYYLSLPTEVKAMTQEMYPYVMDIELKDFFTDTYQGKIIKGLQEFDKESFYKVLREEAEKYFERSGQEPTEEKINSFFESVRRSLISKYIKSANSNHLVIDKKFVNKKSLKDLIDYMAVQIKGAGNRLHKNVGRLYSLKMN